jgi:hypothetical protein
MHKPTTQTHHATPLPRVRNTLATLALAVAIALFALTTTPATARTTADPAAGYPDSTPTIVRVSAPANGFDWGDAAIGAAAGLAISLVAVGSTLALTRKHHRHTTINPTA